jgi:2'-5' RNA ligase
VIASRVPEIERSLQSALEGHPPFEVVVAGLGCFPSASRPRVVWIGIQDQTGWLVRTQQGIEAALARIGFAREDRPFSPHLTLGRLRDGLPPAAARGVGEALGTERPSQPCGMPVSEVKLYRSELRPGGAVYSALWVGKLEAGH